MKADTADAVLLREAEEDRRKMEQEPSESIRLDHPNINYY